MHWNVRLFSPSRVFSFCLMFMLIFSIAVPIAGHSQTASVTKDSSTKENNSDKLLTPVQSGESSNFSGLALVLKAGTLGGGVELVKSLISPLNVRVGTNFFNLNSDGEFDADGETISFDAKLKLLSASILLDYYILEGLHLTGGVLINKNTVEGTGMPVDNYVVGDNTYTPEEIGALSVKLEPKSSVSPYLGIGFGNPVESGGRVKMFLDIGAVYQGQADVTLEADEGTMIYPSTRQDNVVEENLKDLKWYPVFSLGLSIKLM